MSAISLVHLGFSLRTGARHVAQLLPKGSVTLATSQTGATSYMEPKPAMELNNAATRLEADEERETVRVLRALTVLVTARAALLADALAAAVEIDLAMARAAHARCRPRATCELRVRLLLQPSLPRAAKLCAPPPTTPPVPPPPPHASRRLRPQVVIRA
jgi:hypothetical protein